MEGDFKTIGFPLSKFYLSYFSKFFLSRVVRYLSMQNLPTENDYGFKERIMKSNESFYYKIRFFKSLYEGLIDSHKIFKVFKQVKGVTKNVDYNKYSEDKDFDFYKFIQISFEELEKRKEELVKSFTACKLINEIGDIDCFFSQAKLVYKDRKVVDGFYDFYCKYENLFWACLVLRYKFSKIVEWIITIDRAIYLLEKQNDNFTTTVEIVKIFEEKYSMRNLLILAKKIQIGI